MRVEGTPHLKLGDPRPFLPNFGQGEGGAETQADREGGDFRQNLPRARPLLLGDIFFATSDTVPPQTTNVDPLLCAAHLKARRNAPKSFSLTFCIHYLLLGDCLFAYFARSITVAHPLPWSRFPDGKACTSASYKI